MGSLGDMNNWGLDGHTQMGHQGGIGVLIKEEVGYFPEGPVVKNPSSSAEDSGSIPRLGNQDPTCLRAAKPVRCNY